MSYLHWLVLNDGTSERVSLDDIDASEESAAISRVLIPLTESEVGWPRGKNSPYTAVGEVSGKYALLRLLDERAPLADIAVCLHSRAASGLWRRLWPNGPNDDSMSVSFADKPQSSPWCAVRCYAPENVLPDWFDSWTKSVGIALLRREGW